MLWYDIFSDMIVFCLAFLLLYVITMSPCMLRWMRLWEGC